MMRPVEEMIRRSNSRPTQGVWPSLLRQRATAVEEGKDG